MTNPIIYRGTLTLGKFKELAKIYATDDDSRYNPAKNHETISITKQKDGNWIGEMWKGEQVVTSREVDPSYALTKLITHG